MTAQVFKHSQTRGSYWGGLDPEKPPKTLLDHENPGEISDQTVKKPESRNNYEGGGGPAGKTSKVPLYVNFKNDLIFFEESFNDGANGQKVQVTWQLPGWT